MSEVKLEKATDIKELAKLAESIWLEHWLPKLPKGQTEYMIEKFQSEKAIIEQIANDNYVYFYLKEGETILGYTGLSLRPDQLFLSKLYVKAEFRNQGFGRKAFEEIKKFARENGKDRVVLTVKKTNAPTIAAYKNWGFSIIDSIVTDIGSGYVMDDYVMEYRLV